MLWSQIRRFLPIFGKKIVVFLKNQCYEPIFAQFSGCFLSKKTFFLQFILASITSIPARFFNKKQISHRAWYGRVALGKKLGWLRVRGSAVFVPNNFLLDIYTKCRYWNAPKSNSLQPSTCLALLALPIFLMCEQIGTKYEILFRAHGHKSSVHQTPNQSKMRK
jgi:hypothetical protein